MLAASLVAQLQLHWTVSTTCWCELNVQRCAWEPGAPGPKSTVSNKKGHLPSMAACFRSPSQYGSLFWAERTIHQQQCRSPAVQLCSYPALWVQHDSLVKLAKVQSNWHGLPRHCLAIRGLVLSQVWQASANKQVQPKSELKLRHTAIFPYAYWTR